MVDPGPTLGARLALLAREVVDTVCFDELTGGFEPPVEACSLTKLHDAGHGRDSRHLECPLALDYSDPDLRLSSARLKDGSRSHWPVAGS